MRYLIFDTETNGLPANYAAPWSEAANWPRAVEICWTVVTEHGQRVGRATCWTIWGGVIQPDGWTIDPSVTQVHGITPEMARGEGRPLRAVLTEFLICLDAADLIVAHNLKFDRAIVGAELLRIGMSHEADRLRGKAGVCTMVAGTEVCQILTPKGWKWPKLSELYRELFGRDPERSHRAAADVRACGECFFEMLRRGVL